MAFGFFTPFVEAPVVRGVQPSADMSGSDTSMIDHLRQGVEISNPAHRHIGVLPKLGTGDDQQQLDVVVFGQSSEFTIDSKFEDMTVFDPVVYVQNSQSFGYPVILGNPSFEDPEQMGGYIQPLSVGARDSVVSAADFEPHDIMGQIQDGNEDSFKKTSKITNMIDLREQQQTANLYIDSSDMMGDGSGAIRLVGLFPDDEKILRPFDEARYLSKSHVSGTLTGVDSYDMTNAVVSMSAATDQYVPDGFRAAATGFVYDFATAGVDSLAFGGLKRS